MGVKIKLIEARRLIFFASCMVLYSIVLTPFISADGMNWDNLKTYDSKEKQYTITNAFGFGETIAKIKLDSPEIVRVMKGEDRKIAEFTIQNYDDYSNVFNDMELFDLKHDRRIDRDYKYKIKEVVGKKRVPHYKSSCSNDSQQYFLENPDKCKPAIYSYEDIDVIRWSELDTTKQLKSGTYTLGIFLDVYERDYGEWIMTSYGERLNEWAIWTADLDDLLVGYWNMTNYTASDMMDLSDSGIHLYRIADGDAEYPESVNGVSSEVGTAQRFWGEGSGNYNASDKKTLAFDRNFTINLWANVSNGSSASAGFSSGYFGIALHFYSSGADNFFRPARSGGTLGTEVCNISDYLNKWAMYSLIVYNRSTANYSLFINGTKCGNGTLDWVMNSVSQSLMIGKDDTAGGGNYSIDEVSAWNRTLTTSELQDLYNGGEGITKTEPLQVTLNSPDDDAELRVPVTFNCSGITNGNLIENISLWTNTTGSFALNQSNDTSSLELTDASSTFELSDIVDGTDIKYYIWNCEVCDNSSYCEMSSANRSFSATQITLINEYWVNETTEGNVNFFELNLSASSEISFSSANLIYNETSNEGTITHQGGDNYSVSINFESPAVEEITNLSFHWEINFDGGLQVNGTEHNQSVLNLSIDDCSNFGILLLNYTLLDEETQEVINVTRDNSTIEIDVDIYSVGGTTPILEYSQNYSENSNPQVCLASGIGNSTYELFVETRYDTDLHSAEFHNIHNFTLLNSSLPQNINLYDLKLADAQRFLITFRDADFLPVEDALIDIQRKYTSEGVFKSVEIPKTDASGQTTGSFDLDGVLYNIIVTKNNQLLSTFENIAVVCQDLIIGDCRINLNTASSSSDFSDWNQTGDLTYTMDFDEDARTITAIFTTIDGSTKSVSINATQYNRFGNQTICSDLLKSSSGTIICNIPDSFGNVTIITKLFSGTELITTRIYRIIPEPSETFEGSAGVLVLILMLTIPLMLASSTIGVVLGIFIGFIMASMLMIVTSSSLMGVASSMIWLIISGGIIIWKISRRE